MKKYIMFLVLIFSFLKTNAQETIKRDTIYYLLDTTQTPKKDRMWDIFVESKIKCFIIKCPCLQYNSNPTFTYKITDAINIISKKEIKDINTVDISTLIEIAKGNLGKLHTYPVIIFIEKHNKSYIIHKVRLQTPIKPIVIIDSITVTDTTSKKHK